MTHSRTTLLALTLTMTLTLTSAVQAQISFGGGSIRFGGSGRGKSGFNMGRQVQSAVQQTWRQVNEPSRQITDMRYRGPDPEVKRIVVGGSGISVGRDFLMGKSWNPEFIIDDPGYGEPQPCPKPIIDNPFCTQPRPIEPTPVVRQPELVQETDPALQLTYEAQDAFKMQNYTLATEKMNQVLALSPESAAAYQFRALTHFAQGNYDQAASDVYETLLRGPIWNWKTIYPLYGNKYTYTNQYRALARDAKEHPESMSRHFVLAYHHLLLGHLEPGKKELQHVLKLQPNEPVTQQLLDVVQQLQTNDSVAKR